MILSSLPKRNRVPVARLVPVEEGLYYDEQVIFERNILNLSFFPQYKRMIHTY